MLGHDLGEMPECPGDFLDVFPAAMLNMSMSGSTGAVPAEGQPPAGLHAIFLLVTVGKVLSMPRNSRELVRLCNQFLESGTPSPRPGNESACDIGEPMNEGGESGVAIRKVNFLLKLGEHVT